MARPECDDDGTTGGDGCRYGAALVRALQRKTVAIAVVVVVVGGIAAGIALSAGGSGHPVTVPGTRRPAVPAVRPPAVPAGAFAVDTFHRVVSGGWGGADVGGPWVVAKGASADLSVDGHDGSVAVRAGPFLTAEHIVVLPATSVADFEGTFDVSFMEDINTVDPAYGGVLAYVVARYRNAGATGYYRLGLVWDAATRRLWLRTQNPVGKGQPGDFTIEYDTGIDPTADFPAGPPYGPYRVAVRISGSDPTTFASKVWRAGGPEPSGWMLTGRDGADRGPQVAGPVGVRVSDDLQSSPRVYLDFVAHVRIGNLVLGPATR